MEPKKTEGNLERVTYCVDCKKGSEYNPYDPEYIRCDKFLYAFPRNGYCSFGKEEDDE